MAGRMRHHAEQLTADAWQVGHQRRHAQGAHQGRSGLAAAGARPLPVDACRSRDKDVARAGRRSKAERRTTVAYDYSCARSCCWCRRARPRPPSRRASGGRGAARPFKSCDEGIAFARALTRRRGARPGHPQLRRLSPEQLRKILDEHRRRPPDAARSHRARRRDVRGLRQEGDQSRHAGQAQCRDEKIFSERFEQQAKRYLRRSPRAAP